LRWALSLFTVELVAPVTRCARTVIGAETTVFARLAKQIATLGNDLARAAFRHTLFGASVVPLVTTAPGIKIANALFTFATITANNIRSSDAPWDWCQADSVGTALAVGALTAIPAAAVITTIHAATPRVAAGIEETNRRLFAAAIFGTVDTTFIALTEAIIAAVHHGATTAIVDALFNTKIVPGNLAAEFVQQTDTLLTIAVSAKRHVGLLAPRPEMAETILADSDALSTVSPTSVGATLLASTIGNTDAEVLLALVLDRTDSTFATTAIDAALLAVTVSITCTLGHKRETPHGPVVTVNDQIVDTTGRDFIGYLRFAKGQAFVLPTRI